MATWYTAASVLDENAWRDMPDDALADRLLSVAKQQVLAYAPRAVRTRLTAADAPVDGVPDNLVLAQLEQAKNLYTAGSVDSSGGMGDGESFVARPHPLDWIIKQIIRPKRGAPSVR
ncbi:hypothetical protein [Diaminobutyricimonas sp. LJ205]|uniref:hypothetical protein n=1 Tax=Diaminobutyricimonas sp. LJ205 TaxID=2683590 RepID=UPI0012F51C7F|nr:hypothetical protein [Diaminobutyricimonas sp. LJ205]